MASSSQIPSTPTITPKEEPDTQDIPKSPNPFLPVDQVGFTFDEITFSTNNEYTAKALENSRIWVSTPIGGIIGEIGVITFRNAIGAHYSNEYVESHSLTIVKP
ncbi:hypothetical protein Tco_0161143 [Tanacetum coccineum]